MDTAHAKKRLELWIDQYGSLIFSICYKITRHYFDAQDLTQETFLSAFEHMDRFDGGNEQAWLCKIATNLSLDYLKRASRRSLPTEDSYFLEIESKTPSPLQQAVETDLKEGLKEICGSLKPPYNQIATDYFYREMTAKEIAAASGKNLKTVQTQIYRARGMLKKLWKRR